MRSQGKGAWQAAGRLGVSCRMVVAGGERYRTGGLFALRDAPRLRRPLTVDEAEIDTRLAVRRVIDARGVRRRQFAWAKPRRESVAANDRVRGTRKRDLR